MSIEKQSARESITNNDTSTGTGDIQIQMLYFASARTAIDVSSEKLHLMTPFPLSHLKNFILSRYNQNQELEIVLGKSAFSVNEEIVYEEDYEKTLLQNGDVVAIIPPVSGG